MENIFNWYVSWVVLYGIKWFNGLGMNGFSLVWNDWVWNDWLW